MTDLNQPNPEPARANVAPARKPPGVITLLLISVSYFCLLLMDPFGIGTASHQRSEEAALRVTAPFYSNSGDVVVVLIDDDFLARSGQSWPLPYADQGRLLRTIVQSGPAVVFLDMLYRQKHGKAGTRGDGAAVVDDPMNLLTPINSFADTKLIFSAQIRSDLRTTAVASICPDPPTSETVDLLDPLSLLPEIRSWQEARNDRASVALIGWWGCGDRYPLRLHTDGQSTPAVAMLEAYCRDSRHEQAGCKVLRERGSNSFTAPLVVRWGAFPPALQRQFYSAGVCQPYADADGSESAWRSFRISITQLMLGIFEDLRDSSRPDLSLPCPAVTVLPASIVRFGDSAEVRALLRDKIVLVGARITGVSDWHQSPVHGQVPGVILHAAAVDNLLGLGNRYARDMSSGWAATASVLVLAMVTFFVPIVVILLKEPRRRVISALGFLAWLTFAWFLSRAGASPHSVYAAVVVGIAIDLLMPIETLKYLLVLLLFGGGAALSISLGVAPSNWIGMMLVALAFAATVKHFFRQEELKQFPNAASFLGPAVKPWVEKAESWRIKDSIDRFADWRTRRQIARVSANESSQTGNNVETSGESP